MNRKIEWYDISDNMPPVIDEYYIIEDTSGNIYVDKFIYKPFENSKGYLVECDWENTHRAYVKRWSFIDGLSLRDYLKLTWN